MNDKHKDELFKAKEKLRLMMLKTAKSMAESARIFGIEISPDEALKIMQEEQINAYRQVLREMAVQSLRDASDE